MSAASNESTQLEVHLAVYRRLDNRSEGLPDDSARALALHNHRKNALHKALETNAWAVTDWGDTDDARPHELVETIVTVASNPRLHAIAITAATWVGLELLKAGLGALASEAVKALLARLIPQQQRQRISEIVITLPDGTIIRCDQSSEVTIHPSTGISTPPQLRD